jgi:hypothetical protein
MRSTSQQTGAFSLNLPGRYMVLRQTLTRGKGYKVDRLWKWIGVAAVGIVFVVITAYIVFIQNQLETIVTTTNQINATLSLANRAYIISGATQIDEFNGTLTLPLRNTGRIPSGRVVVVIHTATVNAVKPHLFPDVNAAAGSAWQQRTFNSLLPGDTQEVVVQLQKFFPKRVAQALQMIVIGGQIIYNDGLPDDQLNRKSFCTRTIYDDNAAQISWSDCDPDTVLPQLVALDGYPKSQQSR